MAGEPMTPHDHPTKRGRGGARPGAGRKPKPEGRLVTLGVRIRPETKDWLSEQAAILGFSVSRYAESILEEARREGLYREGLAPHPLLQED